MERKRELTSVDCRALVRELGDYEGAKVDKAYLYGDDLLRLRMRDFERGRLELIVEVGEFKRAHLADPANVPDAPGRPPEFAMMLRNRIAGADFEGVEQYGFDRVLTFTFSRTDGQTTGIVAELFGDGNVAVLDGNGEVIRSLETVRLNSRTVAPGAVYDYPDARFDPLTADYDAFAARMDGSDADVVRTLATQLNFGGSWGEELCTRADVPYNQPIEETTEAEYRALYDAMDRLREALRSGAFDARVYYEYDGGGDGSESESGDGREDGYRADASPFPLAEREGQDCVAFDRFNAALDDYFSNFEAVEQRRSGRTEERPDFEAEIEKYERIIAQQEGAIEEFEEQAARERERAELLYARYDTVDAVIRAVRSARENEVPWEEIETRFEEGAEQGIPEAEAVVDVDGGEGTVTLALDDTRVEIDPSEGVEQNADRLYQAAKRVAGKKEGALEAIEDTRDELAAARERRERYEREEARESDGEGEGESESQEEEGPTDEEWLARSSIPVRYDEQWYERFRWFHTSDGFLVIGGRNADQNEELVSKYMERHDRFFHSQAHGGPATILKAAGPSESSRAVDFPERTLEEAAQFAVSYSSAWKEGRYADDAYAVDPDQVSKTPESGEYLSKGGFAIRGDRTYFRDVPAEVAVGVAVEPESRVLGGPPPAIEPRTVTSLRLEPGRYAQNDAAKLVYREFRERFADQSFLRKIASPDRIQEFLPPGGSAIVEE